MLRQSKQPKKKPKYQSTIKRTLHYFLKANWKYKWYAIALLIVTPIVIFVRQILSPLVIANVIGILSSAGPEDFINNEINPILDKYKDEIVEDREELRV